MAPPIILPRLAKKVVQVVKKTLNLTFEIFRAQISPKSKMFCLKIKKKFLGKKPASEIFFGPPISKSYLPPWSWVLQRCMYVLHTTYPIRKSGC